MSSNSDTDDSYSSEEFEEELNIIHLILNNRIEKLRELPPEKIESIESKNMGMRLEGIKGDLDILKLLLLSGDDINNRKYKSLLSIYSECGNFSIVLFLLEKGVDISPCTKKHKKIINREIERRREEVRKVLLEKSDMYKDVISVVEEYVWFM